jgi:hypothetical protein
VTLFCGIESQQNDRQELLLGVLEISSIAGKGRQWFFADSDD